MLCVASMLFNRKIYPQSEAKSDISFLKRCQIVGIGAGLDKEWEEEEKGESRECRRCINWRQGGESCQ